MRRTAPLVTATLLCLAAAGCSDSRTSPTAPLKAPTGPLFQTASTVSLDTRILTLADSIFPKGLGSAFTSRWTDIKRQLVLEPNGTLPDGKKGPAAAARKMLVELVQWVQGKTGNLTPPAGEIKAHVAARLVLYMSLYVYGGPTTPPPAVTATTDAVLSVVSPTAPDTVQTPTQHAGVVFDAGAVTEPTIVVVALETAFYPQNCSGPLVTHLCQYPRFYRFNVFPDVRLQHPAHVAVCHVDAGTNRLPLADHNRFRLAHDKPASPADYVTGNTVVDSIEILPLVWLPTLINCTAGGGTDYTNTASASPLNSRSGGGFFGGLLQRGGHALRTVASAVGRFISPRSAYAIDGGGGGDVMDFSNFAVVDPLSAPDLAPGAGFSLSQTSGLPGAAITVNASSVLNSGTGTSPSFAASLVVATDSALTLGATTLRTDIDATALPPGSSFGMASQLTALPAVPGTYYIGVRVDPANAVAESDESNNFVSMKVTVLNPSPSYTIADLGALPGGVASAALGVNDAGDIVGWSAPADGAHHAVLWHNGTIIDLGMLAGGTTSEAYAINQSGQVVGFSDGPGFSSHATVWSASPPYAVTDVGTLPTGTASSAHGLNSLGQVVGKSLTTFGNCCSPTAFHGFSFDFPTGPMQDLGAVATFRDIYGTVTTEAYGISDGGVISGAGRPYWTGEFFGWVRYPGDSTLYRPLGLDQGNSSIPIAINGQGQMAGWSRIYCPQTFLCDAAVTWASPSAQAVLLVDTTAVHSSRANGISSAGDAVGYARAGGTDQAMFWAAGQTTGTSFATLPGAIGSYPQAINSSRLIVGFAQLPAGPRAFSFSIMR
jgi:probable HAF family extracellular repeat protein